MSKNLKRPGAGAKPVSRTFSLAVEATITMNIEVKAASLPEAIRKAQKAGTMSLCHQCAHGERGTWNTSGELDAEPQAGLLVEATDQSTGASVLEDARLLW